MLEGATIVFDLDGTLVDTAPDLTNALNHALKLHGYGTVAPGLVREAVGRGAPAMIYEALGIESGTDAILRDFLIHYEANIARLSRPFPGAVALLERLKNRGAILAVCTNKRVRLANLLLEALELDHHFATIAGRDTFETSKPHPGHLLGTIAASGGDRARAVMVGDSTPTSKPRTEPASRRSWCRSATVRRRRRAPAPLPPSTVSTPLRPRRKPFSNA
jgi:phosphoglycolate phosphatase